MEFHGVLRWFITLFRGYILQSKRTWEQIPRTLSFTPKGRGIKPQAIKKMYFLLISTATIVQSFKISVNFTCHIITQGLNTQTGRFKKTVRSFRFLYSFNRSRFVPRNFASSFFQILSCGRYPYVSRHFSLISHYVLDTLIKMSS